MRTVLEKVSINENVRIIDRASGIKVLDSSKSTINLKNEDDVIIYQLDAIINFFDPVVFLSSSLVTGPSFMSISLLFLEL